MVSFNIFIGPYYAQYTSMLNRTGLATQQLGFVLFSILRDFNFSVSLVKVAKGDFQPLWLKGLTLVKTS
jgi:hypothetical protein